ncbi:MAG: hypothetical protein WED34_01220 [Planctomycetales bacterium]
MDRQQIRSALAHVGQALREPEAFAADWNEGRVRYRLAVWGALLVTAVLGTTTYGMTMGLLGGGTGVLVKGAALTLAAGLAWAIPLPALYILNSLSGSRLPASSTLLAALVTVSWGGLAMIASIPVNWFFTVAVPHPGFVLLVNLVVFTGVGVAMIDVFRRVMRRLEPRHVTPTWWLLLVAVIGTEFFYCFGLFTFAAP